MPFFHHENVNLFYTVEGTGPPILLLHGYACDSHDWSFQIPLLLSLNYTVVALDQRGHGRSSTHRDSHSYTLQHFADDAVALLRHLNLGPAIIMGHSMGTVIASIVAVEYPDVVDGLILVHPIYGLSFEALDRLAQVDAAMGNAPNQIPQIAEHFFRNAMYTPRTPEWLKTWHLRRVLGTESVVLRGGIQALVNVFGAVMGQDEKTKEYLRGRKGARLVVCTLEGMEKWEREIGVVDGRDMLMKMDEGTFSHMVDSEMFNGALRNWLEGRQ